MPILVIGERTVEEVKVKLGSTARVERKKEKHAILAVDPGTTTGVAYTEEPIYPGLKAADAFEASPLVVEHINCVNEVMGSAQIADLWRNLVGEWQEQDIPEENMHFVFEDFILRPGKNHSSVRTGLSPVRVTAHVVGMLFTRGPTPNYTLQQPSDAKQRWTNERLKRANLWVVGLEHGRDAVRHAALFYIRALS